jgi:hypothetical protein
MVDNVDGNNFGQASERMTSEEKAGNLKFILHFKNGDDEKEIPLVLASLPLKEFFKNLKALLPHIKEKKIRISFDHATDPRKIEIDEIKLGRSDEAVAARFCTDHKNYVVGSKQQTYDVDVEFLDARVLYLNIYSQDFSDKDKKSIEKMILKIKLGALKLYTDFEYNLFSKYDGPINIGANDVLILVVDENFMESVCQQEGEIAKFIAIKSAKNDKVKQLISKFGSKIVIVNDKSYEILLAARLFGLN